MTSDNVKAIAIGVAALGAAFLAYRLYTVGEKVVTEDLNPASDKNIAYRAVNSVVGGDTGETLGTRLYDFFHPNEAKTLGLESGPAAPHEAKTNTTIQKSGFDLMLEKFYSIGGN